ncbi:TetR/AcrR family transcriptional regulator [Microbulbifer halophilus]|uniref:TetR/AcrR family transcriptional regulator n=1 Tax=Microbulbifer halophilus TaxID=453963 RepID=A0ABW5EFA3_9GAMM|nr:TetR/AcrR family transcriptional regulator [Microbulbifer halophilus]MCW8125751.1 TetR/AcrR family transcriptional regulator [Microbulbifer halophilus]
MTEKLIGDRRSAALPRKPQRKNGREKYEKLLDTLETLLKTREVADISLADLSEAAGVPTASVYHFFPNRDAGVTALADRYFNSSRAELDIPSQAREWNNWQDLITLFCERTRENYEASEPVKKLKFGPEVSWAVRDLLQDNNRRLARTLRDLFAQAFELPPSQDWEERFLQAITINDAFWSLSYARHGRISNSMAAEGRRAAIAYLKLYLGELLERRQLAVAEELSPA